MSYAVIPIKRLSEAKSRLALALTPSQRAALVLAMLEDVLAAVRHTPQIQGYAVISRDASVLALASRLGADPIMDQAEDLNGALTQAAALVATQGRSLLVLHGDLPLLQPGDLCQLLAHQRTNPGVVLAPSRDGGTNALLVRPANQLRFAFGADSFQKHLAAAREAQLPTQIVDTHGLRWDLDQPHDLDRFVNQRHPGATGRLMALWSVTCTCE